MHATPQTFHMDQGDVAIPAFVRDFLDEHATNMRRGTIDANARQIGPIVGRLAEKTDSQFRVHG